MPPPSPSMPFKRYQSYLFFITIFNKLKINKKNPEKPFRMIMNFPVYGNA